VIDPFVQVRPEVIAALGKLARGESAWSREPMRRAPWHSPRQAAIPDLLESMKSKDDAVLYESLIAIQKSATGARRREPVPVARPRREGAGRAIETTGILQYKEALPDLVDD